MLIEIVLVAGGVSAFSVWLSRLEKKTRVRIRAAWAEAARLLGGRHTGYFPTSFWSAPWHRIQATVDTIAVDTDHFVDKRSAKHRATFTRHRCAVPSARRLRLKVSHASPLSGIASALGAQDLQVDDTIFDERYVIKSDQPELARAYLTPMVRDAIYHAAGHDFVLDGGQATATAVGLLDDPSRIASGARALAAFAASGMKLDQRWQQVAADLGGKRSTREWGFDAPCARGTARIEATPDMRTIRVRLPAALDARDLLAVTRESLPATLTAVPQVSVSHLPPGWTVVADFADRANARLDQATCAEIAALSCALVLVDANGVIVLLPGIEPNVRTLERALALAAALVSGEASPYR